MQTAPAGLAPPMRGAYPTEAVAWLVVCRRDNIIDNESFEPRGADMPVTLVRDGTHPCAARLTKRMSRMAFQAFGTRCAEESDMDVHRDAYSRPCALPWATVPIRCMRFMTRLPTGEGVAEAVRCRRLVVPQCRANDSFLRQPARFPTFPWEDAVLP